MCGSLIRHRCLASLSACSHAPTSYCYQVLVCPPKFEQRPCMPSRLVTHTHRHVHEERQAEHSAEHCEPRESSLARCYSFNGFKAYQVQHMQTHTHTHTLLRSSAPAPFETLMAHCINCFNGNDISCVLQSVDTLPSILSSQVAVNKFCTRVANIIHQQACTVPCWATAVHMSWFCILTQRQGSCGVWGHLQDPHGHCRTDSRSNLTILAVQSIRLFTPVSFNGHSCMGPGCSSVAHSLSRACAL